MFIWSAEGRVLLQWRMKHGLSNRFGLLAAKRMAKAKSLSGES